MSALSAARLTISPEMTPNPNSIKFVLNRTLLAGKGRDFPDAASAVAAPLARELFLLNGIRGVFAGPNFVTVSIQDGVDWWGVKPLVEQCIETHVASGLPALDEAAAAAIPEAHRATSAAEAGIISILENEIRPAVAMDGGDITFAGYQNGILKLHLRGSCHSCPSATVTLKMGIETRLKKDFPELISVEAV